MRITGFIDTFFRTGNIIISGKFPPRTYQHNISNFIPFNNNLKGFRTHPNIS